MSRANQKLIAWLLVLALVLISGAGEGLHFIPGCGHGIEIGDRVLFIGNVWGGHGTPINDRPCVERPDDQSIRMWDEDECPICSLLAESFSPSGLVQFVFVAPFADELPVAVVCVAAAPVPRLCQARAPPAA